MSPAVTPFSTIPPAGGNLPINPLDLIVQNCGRKLCGLQMTRLVGEPDKGDAQSLTRDLLDIAKTIDDALLAIGREAKAHFGSAVDLSLFADQLLGAIEGNATFTICAAVEARDEEIAAEIDGDARYKMRRDYAAA
jgi:hypothetical protein